MIKFNLIALWVMTFGAYACLIGYGIVWYCGVNVGAKSWAIAIIGCILWTWLLIHEKRKSKDE